MASGPQAIASEHRIYQDRSKKRSGNIERDPAIPNPTVSRSSEWLDRGVAIPPEVELNFQLLRQPHCFAEMELEAEPFHRRQSRQRWSSACAA
jgi:hypothetical protein